MIYTGIILVTMAISYLNKKQMLSNGYKLNFILSGLHGLVLSYSLCRIVLTKNAICSGLKIEFNISP